MKTKHWTDIKFSKDILTDALTKHILGLTQYGMADFAEVMEVISQVKKGDEESWINTWSSMAQKLKSRAELAEKKSQKVTASTAYLRASTYFRVATMYFGKIDDPRMKNCTIESHNCYEKYLGLSGYPGKYVEIPYENTYLPGHYYHSPIAKEKAPLLIITPGRDTWAEDTRWVYDGAIKRGINCLIYDGPGQGFALRLGGLPFRPDWENVMKPVVDFALTLPGVDRNRIGLMGLSFGGFLIPRAVAFEKRVKLCIVDPGNINWGGAFAERLQVIKRTPKFLRPSFMNFMLQDYAWKQGVSEDEVIEELKKYDNTSILDKITCRMLVMDGTKEPMFGEAKKFYDALKCPKDYMLFDEDTTAQAHCQMGSYATGTEYLFDWISDNL
ncbi:MAG: alpha/beta fold hydrolase [Clostridiales bacterium]|nr:alpha/beta fold hydrolase [Clostridiales bacterium]